MKELVTETENLHFSDCGDLRFSAVVQIVLSLCTKGKKLKFFQ